MSSADAPQKILIIDDEVDVHYSFRRLFEKEAVVLVTASSGDEGIQVMKKEKPDIIVMDIRMGKVSGLDTLRALRQVSPKQIVIMMTAYGSAQTAIEAMKLGAFDFILKPFDIPQLQDLIKRALDAAHAMQEKVALPASLGAEDFRTGIVGTSPPMQQVYKLVGQVAPTDATVLIHGESGTGKELVARAIYSNSHRANKTFLAINCAAIPENLLESELFGHEKGSFTGALNQRIGKFEQCDGGTLFLDEIGEMPMAVQSKLLRVLQDGSFSRVGSNQSIKTDVRIVAATNRNLAEACKKREFREDLYYRLNVVSLVLPPLRQRLADIPVMVSYFMNKWRSRTPGGPAKISADALTALKNYGWPGNVRELENVIQRAMVLANGDTITQADLPPDVTHGSLLGGGDDPPSPSSSGTPIRSIDDAIALLLAHAKQNQDLKLLDFMEREFISRALQDTNGNQVQAAKLLGITRATLRKRIDNFGIHKETEVT
jgi:two-component system nitrogen regulation response regulator GlnG